MADGQALARLALPGGHGGTEAWARDALNEVRARLVETGVCWLRSRVEEPPDLSQRLLALLGAAPMEDVFWSTPRTRVSGTTFTATEYPAARSIPLHSEMAYRPTFPRLLCFHALQCAARGGETTLVELDTVAAELHGATAELVRRGVRYVRVFRPGIDIPLATAFGTDDRNEVTRTAAQNGMDVEFLDAGAVRVSCQARGGLVAEERPLWFNQIHLFHPAMLGDSTRGNLVRLFGKDGLPRRVLYGDGAEIDDELVRETAAVLDRHAVAIDWQPGDVVVVDNLRFAHGRRPFEGERVLHVAMGMPASGTDRPPLRFDDGVEGSA